MQPAAAIQHQYLCADGVPLHVTDYPGPYSGDSNDRGIVLLHGIGEHSGRYLTVIRFFRELGYSVRCFDHRGHGKSGGQRGDTPSDSQMLEDAASVIREFAQQLPSPPMLFGHSMGGLLTCRLLAEPELPVSGAILSAPALALYMPFWGQPVLRLLLKLAPGLGLPNGLSLPHLCHDPEVIRAYQRDPLVHDKISARLLSSMLVAIRDCHQQASGLRVPVLMMIAGADKLVDPAGSEAFAAAAPQELISVCRYPEAFHEILNEPLPNPAWADIRHWLTRQSSQVFSSLQQRA